MLQSLVQNNLFPKMAMASFSCLLWMANLTAAPWQAAFSSMLLNQIELEGEDKNAFEELMQHKAVKAGDKLMAAAYNRLLARMSGKYEKALMREEQRGWNESKEKETLRLLRAKGKNVALAYLEEATAERQETLDMWAKNYGKTGRAYPDLNLKMPDDPDFLRADALMTARYKHRLSALSGKKREDFVQGQRDWNLFKEWEYARISDKEGVKEANADLIERTRKRADELQ